MADDSLNWSPAKPCWWQLELLAIGQTWLKLAIFGWCCQLWPGQPDLATSGQPSPLSVTSCRQQQRVFFWMFLVELKQKLLLWKVLKMFLFTYASYAPLNADLLFPSFKLLLFCTPFPVSDFEMNPSWLCESFPDKYESMVLSDEKIFLTFLGGTKCFLAAKCFQRKRY